MNRLLGLAAAALLGMACATASSAANWTKVGTSTAAAQDGKWLDCQRLLLSDIVVDGMGNVWATANYNDSNGSVTCYLAGGGKVEYNLADFGLNGPVTKLVAAGDSSSDGGTVYALQSYVQISFNTTYAAPPADVHRILQLSVNDHPNPAGGVAKVTKVWCPMKPPATDCTSAGDTGTSRISDLTVNWDDGNLYWVMNGGDSYWKYHLFWRYDVVTRSIEESPGTAGVNMGMSDSMRMAQLEYVGDNQFAMIGVAQESGHSSSYRRLDYLSWVDGRHIDVVNGASDPGWGRDWLTKLAYDPVGKKLWMGARSLDSVMAGFPDGRSGSTLILSRWNGDLNNGSAGLFTIVGPSYTLPSVTGIGTSPNANVWHANGNNPQATGVANFNGYVDKNNRAPEGVPPYNASKAIPPRFWTSALAVAPDGRAWMSYSASATYTYPDLGHVMVRGGTHTDEAASDHIYEYFDAGAPQANSYVVGLTFSGSTCYALVLSRDDYKYSVYKTSDTTISAPDLTAGGMKNASSFGLVVQTDENKVVTMTDIINGFFYMEDKGRAGGIKVIPADPNEVVLLSVGSEVGVHGFTGVSGGEAAVTGATFSSQTGTALNPLLVRNSNLGGAKTGLQAAVSPGIGMNNIGLLVRVAGKVTEFGVDSVGNYMRVDDGSGGTFGTGALAAGVKVYYDLFNPPSAGVGDMVQAVGVVRVTVGDDVAKTLEPTIAVRDASDITTLAP